MGKMHADELAWWGGVAGLAAVLGEDAAAHLTGALPVMAMWLRVDLLATVGVFCVVAAITRWMIAPIREVYLHGWHARGEEEERRRSEGRPDAQVRYLPSAVYGSALAQVVPDDVFPPQSRRRL